MDCLLVKCGVSHQVPRIREDGSNRKARKSQGDGIVVSEEATTVKSKKWHQRRRLGSKEIKMVSSSRLRPSQRGRVELGGWLAAWLEEAEGQREKDEVKELEKACKG
ncbi:unnamed protein product [Citrullus colocynthis]|uniref:Uncharacterized protein n=1 Tax=Citrullus colocynthis TaxID=252529 RepID=A0ABP0Y7P1_9ROSI